MIRTFLYLSVTAVLASSLSGADHPPEQRKPVLVELFTSEGCSSCPPADTLLERLDRIQPVPGALVIVLSEHVDYWDRLGWVDPYSSPAFSARQQEYAWRFRIDGPYTPQMIVDGRTEFVGSNARMAESAIISALKQPKCSLRIDPGERDASVHVDPLPPGIARKAEVFAAYAADSGTQDVLRGENKGRQLHHVAIVKEIKRIGTVDGRRPLQTTVPFSGGSRLVVFVQEPGSGAVIGAAIVGAATLTN